MTADPVHAIVAERLTKRFGSLTALDEVSFKVGRPVRHRR